MIKSRMETYNSKKKKQMKKLLIGGLVTTSLIGISELTSNTYAYFTDQVQVTSTFSTAFVFPSRLQEIVDQLESCKSELDDMIQKKQFDDKRIAGILLKKSSLYDQLQSYFDRAQRENQNSINVQSILRKYLNNQQNQGNLIIKDTNSPLMEEQRDSAQQELNKFIKSKYGLLDSLMLSNQDKDTDLYEAMRGGLISSYAYVLYLERIKPENIDYINYFISINEQIVNQVRGTSKVLQYVNNSLSYFDQVSNEIDNDINVIRDIQEQLRKEAEEKAKKEKERKEKEEKERKEKEEKEKKKAEEEKQNKANKNNSDQPKVSITKDTETNQSNDNNGENQTVKTSVDSGEQQPEQTKTP